MLFHIRTMSDVINANPTIIDISSLPKRETGSESSSLRKQNELINNILSLSLLNRKTSNTSSRDPPPDLSSDVEMDNVSTEDELEEYIEEEDLEHSEEVDAQEIFDLISTISDPEHPLTLAQLAVVNLPDITVTNGANKKKDISEVLIKITPTITHCSLATLIGLGIRVRLERCLPPRFRIRILIKEGTHQSENQVNKQLNDKERVAAACENDQLLNVILQMLSSCK